MREYPTQRRISRERRSYLLPLGLLLFFVADLAWEIVKANLNAPTRAAWPWRLVVLDETTCAALVAVLAGILVTRTQVSRTLAPVLSWSASMEPSRYVPSSRRTVHIYNGGGGRATVTSVSYHLGLAGQPLPEERWLSWHEAVNCLEAAGLVLWRDVMLPALGEGATLPMTSKPSEGCEVAAFSEEALGVLVHCDIRIRFTDILGDVHERTIRANSRGRGALPPVPPARPTPSGHVPGDGLPTSD